MGYLENLMNKELPPVEPVQEATKKEGGLLRHLDLRRDPQGNIEGLPDSREDDYNRRDRWNDGQSGSGRREHA